MFTDKDANVTRLDYEMPFGRRDHVCLMFEVMCHRKSEKEGFKRKYFKGNYSEIRNDISMIDWENELRGKDTDRGIMGNSRKCCRGKRRTKYTHAESC